MVWDVKGLGVKVLMSSSWIWIKNLLAVVWVPRLSLSSLSWVHTWATNWTWIQHNKYEGRCIFLRNRHKRKIYKKLEIDREKAQTKFQKNKFKSSKYTILTFPFLNLFEQFRRAATAYFLVSMVLTLLIDSPISPTSWLMSLIFVVMVTMAKQGYEDYLRHCEDSRANSRRVTVVRKGKKTVITSENIQVGDILYLIEGQEVPCDSIVLSSSHEQGQCYVMTANLDGETSLKTRVSPTLTKSAKTTKQVTALYGCVECENPNPKLDSFLGRLTIWSCDEADEPEVCGLTNDNLLLASTVLKNTNQVFACCVYAGTQTKISLNSKITKNKFSIIEKSLNFYLLFFVTILLTVMTVSTVLSFAFDYEFIEGAEQYLSTVAKALSFFGADREAFLNLTNIKRYDHRDNLQSVLGFESANNYPHALYKPNVRIWYLDQVVEITFVRILEVLLLWMVLYNYIIPLSMYVTLELAKFISSKIFEWDLQLYDKELDQPAICHTSDINEELGVITHLFTDKTGTLTKNEMVLKMYSLMGKVHDIEDSPFQEWNTFMMVLTVCHSVQVQEGHFVASSPDEKAILELCRAQNFIFNGECRNGKVLVTAHDSKHAFEKLAELPFDSYRKCMSVIVRDKEGVIHVLCKGAETTMVKACTSGPLHETEIHVDNFASMGLRTLVLGYKTISDQQFEAFTKKLETAKQSFVNRNKFLRDAYNEMEKDLEMLGATGIEDKLQDEVVETVEDLQKAGIRVWMLTGDKKETAVNLGHSTGLLRGHFKLIDLCDNNDSRDAKTLVNDNINELEKNCDDDNRSIVIDGKSISTLLKESESVRSLRKLSLRCRTVIACRLSPIQKSQLVRLIKEADAKYRTAAIGDGGNDVSMLQEAHIGLGIIGKEGTAAAQASDFAFTKFKYLRRALLVHGHWYYVRVSFLIQYSFYKNIACFTSQFFYAFFSNWSAQTLYESMFLFLFNTMYTSVPVMIYAISEQNIPSKDLLEDPTLYKRNANNALMSKMKLAKWMCLGLWHSAISFFFWYFVWPGLSNLPGTISDDSASLQVAVSQTIVCVVNLKILIEARYWNWGLLLSIGLSMISFLILTSVYHSVGPIDSFILDNTDMFMAYPVILGEPLSWIVLLLTIVTALLPDVVLNVLEEVDMRKPKSNQTVPFTEPSV